MIKRFSNWAVAVLLVAGYVLGWTTDARCDIISAQLVQDGRALLTAQDVVGADQKFAAALAADPNDEQANFFRAVTRMLVLVDGQEYDASPEMDSMKEFMDALHWAGNRNVYDMCNTLPTDALGHAQFYSGAPTGGQLSSYMLNKLLGNIADSANNLEHCSPDFTVALTPAETMSMDNVLVDSGDVKMFLSVLYLTKAAIEVSAVYNVDLDPYDLYNKRWRTDTNCAFSPTYWMTPGMSTFSGRTQAWEAT